VRAQEHKHSMPPRLVTSRVCIEQKKDITIRNILNKRPIDRYCTVNMTAEGVR